MIKAQIKQGTIKFVGKHEYEKKEQKQTLITYIVRDCETDKSKESLVCLQFADGHDLKTLSTGDTVTVKGTLHRKYKRDSDGKVVTNEKGRFETEDIELYIDQIDRIETPETKPEPLQPLPFDLTEEQKASLTPEQRAALNIK